MVSEYFTRRILPFLSASGFAKCVPAVISFAAVQAFVFASLSHKPDGYFSVFLVSVFGFSRLSFALTFLKIVAKTSAIISIACFENSPVKAAKA
jgi:hypothetical protein